jgi:hypothetical protein
MKNEKKKQKKQFRDIYFIFPLCSVLRIPWVISWEKNGRRERSDRLMASQSFLVSRSGFVRADRNKSLGVCFGFCAQRNYDADAGVDAE